MPYVSGILYWITIISLLQSNKCEKRKLGQSLKKVKWKFKRKQFISNDGKTYPAIYVPHKENDRNENADASDLTNNIFSLDKYYII